MRTLYPYGHCEAPTQFGEKPCTIPLQHEGQLYCWSHGGGRCRVKGCTHLPEYGDQFCSDCIDEALAMQELLERREANRPD